jgi:hypothetical protein
VYQADFSHKKEIEAIHVRTQEAEDRAKGEIEVKVSLPSARMD